MESLRSAIAGDVFLPGEPGYDEARRTWNLIADERPALVVVVRSADDVVAAVRFAGQQGMRIAPQGTGHGSAPLEALDGAMQIRTGEMRKVVIDPEARTARVQAGAAWRDVTVPAAAHGLAGLAGTSPNVGVVGYTLGGGLGWLARRFGLAANSVIAADIVTPNGRLIHADSDNEPDLLWTVRGGGGGVGVVTALEIALYPVSEIYAGTLFFPIQRSSEILHAWREWTNTLPDAVTSTGRILRVPSIPSVPEQLRGREFVTVEAACIGDATAGAEQIKPLRQLNPEIDTFAMTPAPELGRLHMDPEEPVPFYGDGALLTDFPAAAVDAVVSQAGPDADTTLDNVEVRHLGGRLAQAALTAGAQPKLEAEYLVFSYSITPTQDIADAALTHAHALNDALAGWRAAYDEPNIRQSPVAANCVLSPASFRRLQEIRAKYDPEQAIISVHPAWPAHGQV
ncbi:MAG TPA: FAD-dependent oxidoreductase [Trebonia sp.]|nr:FAD-dependent oxidoreductase [Trebonia sp.]